MMDELELLITGRQFHKICEREYETIRKKYGLRKIELDLLYFLHCSAEAETARDIAAIQQVSKAHISSAVENLVGKKLLETREDEADRRRMLLELTEEGREIVKEVVRIRKRMANIVYYGITDYEKEVMQQAARKMMQNMQKELKATGKENAE